MALINQDFVHRGVLFSVVKESTPDPKNSRSLWLIVFNTWPDAYCKVSTEAQAVEMAKIHIDGIKNAHAKCKIRK